MKVGGFFVGKEGIRDPDPVSDLCSHDQFMNPGSVIVLEAGIHPGLPEVKVTREIHLDLGDGGDADDQHLDAHVHWWP